MGLFDTNKKTEFFRNNPIIQRIPTDQVGWSFFIQELTNSIFEQKGSFTPTWSGFSTNPVAGIVYWTRSASMVTLTISTANLGTSNAATFQITNLPQILQPTVTQTVAVNTLVNNGNVGWGNAIISGATIDFAFQDTDGASWTATGTKGFGNSSSTFTSITYSINTSTT